MIIFNEKNRIKIKKNLDSLKSHYKNKTKTSFFKPRGCRANQVVSYNNGNTPHRPSNIN